jgi:hypothetical protein
MLIDLETDTYELEPSIVGRDQSVVPSPVGRVPVFHDLQVDRRLCFDGSCRRFRSHDDSRHQSLRSPAESVSLPY